MSHRTFSIAVAGSLILASAVLTGCGPSATAAPEGAATTTEAPETLVISKIPSEDQTSLDVEESVVVEILERELGIPVEFHAATSYAATIEAQRSGKAHIAQYGPFSYILAADSGVPLELIGAPTSDPNATQGYHSVASVKSGSDITSLADAKGKTVCFVDPASTSGYLFPSAGLLEAGLDPENDITPVYAGGHDAAVLAVADAQCDIAFSTEKMATEQLIESGQISEGQLTQIWKSELITPSPITLSASLPADMRDKIKKIYLEQLNVDALMASGDCDESADDGFCGLESWGYLPIEDSDFDGVRAVCDVTKSDACAITAE